MNAKIALVPGDGIGPDVTAQAVAALDAVAARFGHRFEYQTLPAGGCAIDAFGTPLPAETLEACKASDAVLLGAVGGPKWDHLGGEQRPEKALLGLRQVRAAGTPRTPRHRCMLGPGGPGGSHTHTAP